MSSKKTTTVLEYRKRPPRLSKASVQLQHQLYQEKKKEEENAPKKNNKTNTNNTKQQELLLTTFANVSSKQQRLTMDESDLKGDPSLPADMVLAPAAAATVELAPELALEPPALETEAFFQSLNESQLSAVKAPPTPLMIVASAGSGKTLTLTARIAWLLGQGVDGSNVLGLTFTRKAAEEMRERIQTTIGWRKAAGVTMSNFHSLCLKILRANYQHLGFRHQFTVLDAQAQKEVVQECVEKWVKSRGGSAEKQRLASTIKSTDEVRLAVETEDARINAALGLAPSSSSSRGGRNLSDQTSRKLVTFFTNFIRKAKSMMQRPDQFSGDHRTIFQMYLEHLHANAQIDFGDMIPLTLTLFRQRRQVLEECQRKWRHVFCDEYQDVTQSQFDLLVALTQASQSITVCGDDDQSIYGWRGVPVQSFQMFKRTFPNSTSIVLAQTYRSTAKIVRAVSALIDHNHNRSSKNLWTANAGGENLYLFVSQNTTREALKIAEEIKRRKQQGRLRWRDFAILGRTRRVLNGLQPLLKAQGIPIYTNLGSGSSRAQSCLKSKEVQDVLAYLQVAASGGTSTVDGALRRIINVPSRGIGSMSVDEISRIAANHDLSLWEATKRCTKAGLFGARLSNSLNKFISMMQRFMKEAHVKSLCDMIDAIVDGTSYKEHLRRKFSKKADMELRQSNITQLLEHAKHFDDNTRTNTGVAGSASTLSYRFVTHLRTADTKGDMRKDFVTLSTIHQAKGLEWPVVFVTHFNEGVLPLPIRDPERLSEESRVVGDPLEEERRLAYVALSRAKQVVFVSAVLEDGGGTPMIPSRFLGELPKELVEDYDPDTVEQKQKDREEERKKAIRVSAAAAAASSSSSSSSAAAAAVSMTMPVTIESSLPVIVPDGQQQDGGAVVTMDTDDGPQAEEEEEELSTTAFVSTQKAKRRKKKKDMMMMEGDDKKKKGDDCDDGPPQKRNKVAISSPLGRTGIGFRTRPTLSVFTPRSRDKATKGHSPDGDDPQLTPRLAERRRSLKNKKTDQLFPSDKPRRSFWGEKLNAVKRATLNGLMSMRTRGDKKARLFHTKLLLLCNNCEDPSQRPTTRCLDCSADGGIVVFCQECDGGIHHPKKMQGHRRSNFQHDSLVHAPESPNNPTARHNRALSMPVPGGVNYDDEDDEKFYAAQDTVKKRAFSNNTLSAGIVHRRDSLEVADGASSIATSGRRKVSLSGVSDFGTDLDDEEVLFESGTMKGEVFSVAFDKLELRTPVRAPLYPDVFKGRVVFVSCGLKHTAAVTDTGSLFMWGDNGSHQLGVPSESKEARSDATRIIVGPHNARVVMAACGYTHTMALTSHGQVYAWGEGMMGKLGLGGDADHNTPQRVPLEESARGNAVEATFIACSQYNSGVIASVEKWNKQVVFMWGAGSHGQIGNGSRAPQLSPVETNIKQCVDHTLISLSLGENHCALTTSSGRIYMWGSNEFGQLGMGEPGEGKIVESPTLLRSLQKDKVKVTRVACGERHTTILAADGTVYSYGSGETHQIGIMDNVDQDRPVSVKFPDDNVRIINISVGQAATYAVSDAGRCYVWGYAFESPVPRRVPEFEQEFVQHVAIGENENIAVLTGTVQEIFSFQYDLQNDTVPDTYPSQYAPLRGKWIRSMSAGMAHTAVATKGGKVMVWGENDENQLGTGNDISYPVPTNLVMPDETASIKSVACGANHTLALATDGRVFSWGEGLMGKLGHGTDRNQAWPKLIELLEGESVTTLACGPHNSGVTCRSGKAYVWGSNGSNQLGTRDNIARLEPSMVPIDDRIVQLGFGEKHCVALARSGHVFACGDNDFGQLGCGFGDFDHFQVVDALKGKKVVKVVCSDMVTLAVTNKGRVYAWGSGETKQTVNATGEDQFLPAEINFSPIGVDGDDKDDDDDDEKRLSRRASSNRVFISDVSMGPINCAALDERGQVYVWGWDLGDAPRPLESKEGVPVNGVSQICMGTGVIMFAI